MMQDLNNNDWWPRSIRGTSKAPGLGQEGPQPWDFHVRGLSSQNTNKNKFIKEHGGLLLSLRIQPSASLQHDQQP